MLDDCLFLLVINAFTLANYQKLEKFLEPWFNISQYLEKLFFYIKKTLPELDLFIRDAIT